MKNLLIGFGAEILYGVIFGLGAVTPLAIYEVIKNKRLNKKVELEEDED